MKFEKTEVWGFDHALRGMRNPKNSWNKSDSHYENMNEYIDRIKNLGYYVQPKYIIGEKDMALANTLIKGGSEHRKFLRQIFISVDITAPLYWWKEFDTYKVGTTANSTSTMHKITSSPITYECFETDDFEEIEFEGGEIRSIIDYCEQLRKKYLETNNKVYWKELIRWLPESWLQTRTVTLNYENIFSMYNQRKHHKLNEWSGLDNNMNCNFLDWVKTLPYAKELIIGV